VSWSEFLGTLKSIASKHPLGKIVLNPPSDPWSKKFLGAGLQRQYGRYPAPIGPVQPAPAKGLLTGGQRMARNIYGDTIPDEFGGGAPRRRRRGGITSRDLRSFKRVANLIRKYAAPVRHMRTHPKHR